MDDDLTFGTSVWATSEPVTADNLLSPTAVNPHSSVGNTAFIQSKPTFDDDFADFGASTEVQDIPTEDDDFGDFGDFGEVVELDDSPATSLTQVDDFRIAGPSHPSWRPLTLNPIPSRSALESLINETLGPIWSSEDITDVTTDDPIREVEGLAQILITPSSRGMYKNLLQTPPPTKPPNWTRSRIRQQHLIALGVPVNLDEMLPRANGKPLPPLEIYTRPASAPPGNRNHHGGSSRDVTPRPGEQGLFAQFGPKPELDSARISKLLQLTSEHLAMQPFANVERYLSEIKAQTAITSRLLTYLLQSRDALQQDSETYNGLIAEMVGQAQSLRSGKPRTASIRRGNSGGG